MQSKVRKMILYALFAALAYVVMYFIRIPVVLFLKYEPKDVIIALAAFILGPLSSVVISLVTAVVECFTVSDTGWIGLVMNFLSSVCFSGTAALIYYKKRTLGGAACGLIAGTLFTTAFMLLWNYLITPLYMGYPRAAVAELLVPYFLPFNLLKYTLNAALVMMLYKPVSSALKRSGLLSHRGGGEAAQSMAPRKELKIAALLISLLLVVTCVLLMLVLGRKL